MSIQEMEKELYIVKLKLAYEVNPKSEEFTRLTILMVELQSSLIKELKKEIKHVA